MKIKINKDLQGSILDIGGGGTGLIGRVYGQQVCAIDNRQDELDEAPDTCQKLLMDARKLAFADESFDNVSFFYTLMYMDEETQAEALAEAYRVLKSGGKLCIWDVEIPSAYPEPFSVDLDIEFGDESIHAGLGIVKLGSQSLESVQKLLEHCGFEKLHSSFEKGHFYLQYCKPARNEE